MIILSELKPFEIPMIQCKNCDFSTTTKYNCKCGYWGRFTNEDGFCEQFDHKDGIKYKEITDV